VIGQAFHLRAEHYMTITTSRAFYTFDAPTAANPVQIDEIAAKFTF
jgi:hypothetical protein